jgi:4-alpha-glucanotransferase
VNVEWIGPGADGEVVYPRPQDLREEALACLTLHDTPPLRSLIDGPRHESTIGTAEVVAPHIALREQLGLTTAAASLDAENARRASVRGFVARLREEGLLDATEQPDVAALTTAIARYLARSKSRLKMWRMSDLGANPEVRPVNLPGVSDGPDGYPCWMVKAETELAELLAQPETGALLESMVREAAENLPPTMK